MNAISHIDLAHYGRLLLFLCCLLPAVAANAQASDVHILWQQTHFTGMLAYSPVQPLLAAVQGFGDISLFHPDGTFVLTVHSGQGIIEALTFAPDGQTLASGSWDGSIKLWRVSDGTCRQAFVRGSAASSMAFAPDGKSLATGHHDGTIKLWRVSDGACLQTLTGHTHQVNAVAFAPDGQTLASGGQDNTVKLWRLSRAGSNEVSGGSCVQTLTGHAREVNSVAFAPDGQTLPLWRSRRMGRRWSPAVPTRATPASNAGACAMAPVCRRFPDTAIR